MGIREKIKDFKDWCPQPHSRLPVKLKNYSAPIVVALVAVLIFSISFSLFASQYALNQAVTKVPIIGTPSNNSSQPSPTLTSTPTMPVQLTTPNPTVSIPTSASATSFPTATPTPNPIWQLSTVDSGHVGAYSSLALDSSGTPHISYFDANNGALKYAGWNGKSWNVQTVDITAAVATSADVGQYSSLALDSNGYPHISYYNYTDFNPPFGSANSSLVFGNLKYAWWDGTTWITQTIDSGHVGAYSSLALDSHNYPHISYYDFNDNKNCRLKYAEWNGTAWSVQIVDSSGNVGLFTSIALDSVGNPHICYLDANNGTLKYGSYNSTGWSIQIVDYAVYLHFDPAAYCSLALDSSNNPRISYTKQNPNISGTNYYGGDYLAYAIWNGTSWTVQTVDSSGGVECSLVLDSSGYSHISYSNNKDLKYAEWNGTAWNIQIVDSSKNSESFTSLALDSAGHPHISYHDGYYDDLKYASFG